MQPLRKNLMRKTRKHQGGGSDSEDDEFDAEAEAAAKRDEARKRKKIIVRMEFEPLLSLNEPLGPGYNIRGASRDFLNWKGRKVQQAHGRGCFGRCQSCLANQIEDGSRLVI